MVIKILAFSALAASVVLLVGCELVSGYGPERALACFEGARDCLDNEPRHCEDGAWTLDPPCPGEAPGCSLGECVTHASCRSASVAEAASCGPSGDASCCRSLEVVGGEPLDRGAGRTATVTTFQLDAFEITVGRYRAFRSGGQGTGALPPRRGAGAHPALPSSGWNPAWNTALEADDVALSIALASCANRTWTEDGSGDEALPMNCLTWFEAFAFCAWDGGRLPTETEWSYAAEGGAEQRRYPWSSPQFPELIDPEHASYDCTGDGSSPGHCAPGDILGVGSRSPGNGRWGHADLAGNLREWTLDSYAAEYPVQCSDCAQLSPGALRVDRGGGFVGDDDALRSSRRSSAPPSYRHGDLGARCARDR
jgi:formylglycine-generating enzyme required for sulfatase activity